MSLPGVPFLEGVPLCPCHGHGLCPDVPAEHVTPEALDRAGALLNPMTPEERAAFVRDAMTDSGVSMEAELAFLEGTGPDPLGGRVG